MIKTRLSLLGCFLLLALFSGCDNRTQDDRHWEAIAQNQKDLKGVQPWKQAQDPWSNSGHHTGLAW